MDSFSTRYLNEEKFPLVVEPKHKMNRQEFFEQLRGASSAFKERLLKEGALLFRNCPIDSVEDFSDCIDALNVGKCVDYVGGDSPRIKVKGNIYTSTEAPPSMKILLHNELSFVKNYPSHIFFYCDVAPTDRGETIIGDSRKIYADIDPAVRKRFEERGLKYYSRYGFKQGLIKNKAIKTWINVFETENKSEVEKKCLENEFAFRWNKNDWLEISQNRPAVMEHPITKEKVWFNQVHLYDFNPRFLGMKYYFATKLAYIRRYTKLHDVYFGDGSTISRQDLYHVMDVLDKNTVAFPWQKGDVMALDNVLAMHGRSPFSGKRRVLTAMTRS